ncbi:MAG: caspase family protein [Fimbriimonas sp.]
MAVDDYPALKSQPKLAGAKEDLRVAQAFVAGYGANDIRSLVQGEATKAKILAELTAIAGRASKGDSVVFYFSGRGGRARFEQDLLQPSLAPFDAQLDTGSNDILMSELEAWSKSLDEKGCRAVLILDACWGKLATRSVEARPYNPTVRFFDRNSKLGMRPELFKGPATVIAATNGSGAAYEWKVTEDTWAGAFTTMLLGAATNTAIRGERPSASDLVGEVGRQTAQYRGQGYMPGFEPYIQGDNGNRFLGGSFRVETEGAIGQLIARRREEAKLYRVAIDIDSSVTDPEERARIYRATSKPFREYLTKNLELVASVEPNSYLPDRIVTFREVDGKLTARVLRENRVSIDQDGIDFSGATIDEVMEAGLGDLIQQDAVIQHFFRLVTQSGLPSESLAVEMKGQYRIGDEFVATVSGATGFTYVFDRSDLVGSLSLQVPRRDQNGHITKADQGLRIPAKGAWKFVAGSPLGRSQYVVIVVSGAEKLGLPALATDSPKSFRASLVPHLKSLVDAIKANRLKVAYKIVAYTVSGS